MTAWLDLIRPKKERDAAAPIDPGSRASAPASVQEEIKAHGAPKIRVVFMGTPEFAAVMLRGLAERKYHIVGVVTKPDKPAGRKQEAIASRVKDAALEYSLPLEQPEKLDEEAVKTIASWKPDLIIVAAYGKILPPELLKIPGFGCINVHASLLPKWRGASPIQNALLAGETETGITIMLMDKGMDTGDILAQKKIAIDPDETRETLTSRLTDEGKNLLLETAPLWVKRTISPVPQDSTRATLCQLIEREDGRIMWTDDAESIYNRYRALSPWPGIFTFWKKGDELLRLKLGRVSYQKQSPQTAYPVGQAFELGEKIGVQTGQGVVFLEEVQLEGKTQMNIAEFLRGNPDLVGGLLQ